MERVEDKKILFLLTQSKYGGAGKYVLQLAKYFSKNNTVCIAVGEKDNQDDRFFREARELGIEPILVEKLVRDISLVKATESVLEIRKLLKKEQPDIIHVNSSMAGAVGSCAAWLYRFDPLNRAIRVVYTVHGFVFNEPLTIQRKKIYELIEKVSASWKGAIITVSKKDKEIGLKHKIAPDKRMVVIHNGIDTTEAPLDADEARKRLNLDTDSPIIGCVASFYATKGHTYLINAFKDIREKHQRARLVLIGDGPLEDTIKTRVAELGLEDAVDFLGARDDAPLIMKAFTVSVLSSVKEGLPFTILEAGRAERAVVATRVGGVPEIIDHQENGLLVDAAKPSELASAVSSLLSDSSLREQYGNALKKKIQREFSLNKMLTETEALYLRFFTEATPRS